MVYKVIWSPEAIHTFEKIIEYLDTHWSEKEVRKFLQQTEEGLRYLQQNPYLFRGSEKENVFELLVSKHNLLLYQIAETHKRVELLSFWDTRQNLDKKHKA